MHELVNWVVAVLKKIIPDSFVEPVRPLYHKTLALVSAFFYKFPARRLIIIGITGTKGKSTTAEMLFCILRAAGYKTALISTIRFAIDDQSERNVNKMTLMGRGFAQAFMQKALHADCTHIVIELTSESTLQFRHWFLDLNGLIVTNIQPEHIERHGSFEKYVAAKREIVRTLERSPKPKRVLVANEDVPETKMFLSAQVPTAIGFSARELENLLENERGVNFKYKNVGFSIPMPGTFSAMNALAAIKMAEAYTIPLQTSATALAKLAVVPGRLEYIDAGQDFLTVVDYAHTPDSLKALYSAFPNRRKICVLGSTGGGRDAWKRPEMGRIAEESCTKVILTNEDPYDEEPRAILDAMTAGMQKKPDIIMDRRAAIATALRTATKGDAVLISGKGTDPFIMGPRGSKIPWSDSAIVREELEKLRGKV